MADNLDQKEVTSNSENINTQSNISYELNTLDQGDFQRTDHYSFDKDVMKDNNVALVENVMSRSGEVETHIDVNYGDEMDFGDDPDPNDGNNEDDDNDDSDSSSSGSSVARLVQTARNLVQVEKAEQIAQETSEHLTLADSQLTDEEDQTHSVELSKSDTDTDQSLNVFNKPTINSLPVLIDPNGAIKSMRISAKAAATLGIDLSEKTEGLLTVPYQVETGQRFKNKHKDYFKKKIDKLSKDSEIHFFMADNLDQKEVTSNSENINTQSNISYELNTLDQGDFQRTDHYSFDKDVMKDNNVALVENVMSRSGEVETHIDVNYGDEMDFGDDPDPNDGNNEDDDNDDSDSSSSGSSVARLVQTARNLVQVEKAEQIAQETSEHLTLADSQLTDEEDQTHSVELSKSDTDTDQSLNVFNKPTINSLPVLIDPNGAIKSMRISAKAAATLGIDLSEKTEGLLTVPYQVETGQRFKNKHKDYFKKKIDKITTFYTI
ncbi:uncharacterized protein DC041_0007272 [Schistosoma bovis]|uniref:Uncharacterized protein n=1 Tax=Schistosoma bovis TaxID=6184 RepID=A0A430QQZ4_SCHBO|nr:uncharacterized protein DC041_0007272 [Schistosoma bovis]